MENEFNVDGLKESTTWPGAVKLGWSQFFGDDRLLELLTLWGRVRNLKDAALESYLATAGSQAGRPDQPGGPGGEQLPPGTGAR